MLKPDLCVCTKRLSLAVLAAGVFSGAQAGMLPDEHAPIGVMGDHAHKSGKLMLSYRYDRMEMDGNRDGTGGVSTAEVLQDFIVSPLDMRMEMHMFGFMYGVNNDLTLMAMMPYVNKSMKLVNRKGVSFKTRSSGVGDIKLVGLYKLYDSGMGSHHRAQRQVSLNMGISLPTGKTDKKDNTPAGNIKLPYPMQLGSGTVDLILGITYTRLLDAWSWGAQAKTMLRFGKNDEGYRLGHEYTATTWAARNLSPRLSASFRLDGKFWGNARGRDKDLNPMMVPTARSDLRGGRRVDALLGFNGVFHRHRITGEFGWPVYQDLDGPQLETDYRFMLGWQKML